MTPYYFSLPRGEGENTGAVSGVFAAAAVAVGQSCLAACWCFVFHYDGSAPRLCSADVRVINTKSLV